MHEDEERAIMEQTPTASKRATEGKEPIPRDLASADEPPKDPKRAEGPDLRPLRLLVRSHYDAQKIRIEMSNRISAQKRAGILSGEWEARLGLHLAAMEATEIAMAKDVAAEVKSLDLWRGFLKGVKGCGPLMAAVIASEMVGPERGETASKVWAYCGLHTIDGAAVRRREGKKANWNPFLKTKLIGVLGPSFLKCGSPYRKFYDDYRARLASRPCAMPPGEHNKRFRGENGNGDGDGGEAGEGAVAKQKLQPNGCTLGHMHNKAVRYMVKQFLLDLHVAWRTMRGLPVRPPYAEEYLGKVHHA